jgi:hypothetical protein
MPRDFRRYWCVSRMHVTGIPCAPPWPGHGVRFCTCWPTPSYLENCPNCPTLPSERPRSQRLGQTSGTVPASMAAPLSQETVPRAALQTLETRFLGRLGRLGWSLEGGPRTISTSASNVRSPARSAGLLPPSAGAHPRFRAPSEGWSSPMIREKKPRTKPRGTTGHCGRKCRQTYGLQTWQVRIGGGRKGQRCPAECS